jgi:hypothetical protein
VVETFPETDYLSEPQGEVFQLETFLHAWTPAVEERVLWQFNATAIHQTDDVFLVDAQGPGRRRRRPNPYQREQQRFRRWKREMQLHDSLSS